MNKLASLCLSLALISGLRAIDNPHFYRATYFYGEPRLGKNNLSSWDVTLAHGSTNQGRNGNGGKTCLLNIFGHNNMLALGEGVPCKSTTDPLDIALINLARLPSRGTFGQLIFNGTFSITEANIFFTHNFNCGLFVEAHMPIRNLQLSDICFKDLSPTDATCPNINTPEWQTFLTLFPQILHKYGLSLASIHHKGFGDASFLLGQTWNYQETEELDYIDFTIKGGILIPTGSTQNENLVFDIPLGYNGHIGIPLSLDLSFGCYDWLTFGVHGGILPFLHRLHTLRLKTNVNQNGFIKLAKGCASVRPGTIFEAGGYIKADHLCRGLSLLFAYSYARQNGTTVNPRSTGIFVPDVVCTDQLYRGWNMGTLNFIAEYDFSKEGCIFGPRVGLFYNRIINGKRIFDTNMVGGSLGLDIALCF